MIRRQQRSDRKLVSDAGRLSAGAWCVLCLRCISVGGGTGCAGGSGTQTAAGEFVECCTAAADGETFNVRIFPYRRIIEHQGEEKAFLPENVVYGKSVAGDGDPVSSGGKYYSRRNWSERTLKGAGPGSGQYPMGRPGRRDGSHTGAFVGRPQRSGFIKICNGSQKLMQEQGVLLAIASKK